jgi:beta-lactamase class A
VSIVRFAAGEFSPSAEAPLTDTRRTALTLLTGAMSAGVLAACGARINHQPAQRGLLDTATLDAGFPPLSARAAPSRLNLGVLSLAGDHVWAADSDGRYPMADLFMLPLAAAALSEVDAGRLKLGEPITIRDVDLSPPPSLIGAAFKGQTTMPAVDLIALAIQHGDNTAADVIMSRIGGPGAVTAWLQSKDIVGMRVDRYAREMATDMLGTPSFRAAWRTQAAFDDARVQVAPAAREAATQAFLRDPRDTTSAPAAMSFLDHLSDGRLLSPVSTRLLIGLMTRSAPPIDGLAAALPPGASLARKTGNSGADLGLTPATNEVGLVTLKDGKRLAVVVFLAGSTATAAERGGLIADAGRLVFRAYG